MNAIQEEEVRAADQYAGGGDAGDQESERPVSTSPDDEIDRTTNMSAPLPERADDIFAVADSSAEEAPFVDDDEKNAERCTSGDAASEQVVGEPTVRSETGVGTKETDEVPAHESNAQSDIGTACDASTSFVDKAPDTPDLTAGETSASAKGAPSDAATSPAPTEVPDGPIETNTDPVTILVDGNLPLADLHRLRKDAQLWDGPDVIVKRKPPKLNGVPWDTRSQNLPYKATPLPKPNSILINLLHNLIHEVERTPEQVESAHSFRILVLSTAGSLGYALARHTRDLTMVHPDATFVRLLKDEPYGCRGTARKMMEQNPNRYLSQAEHECYPSVIYRCAPLDQTGLPPASFDVIIIEQGHRSNIIDIIAEACRLARPNGIIALVSYMPIKVISKQNDPVEITAAATHINKIVKGYFDDEFRRYMSVNERHLLDRFQKLTVPPRYQNFPDFRERIGADDMFPMNKCLMQANWTVVEFLKHIMSWPVLARVGGRPFLHSAGQQFTHEVEKVWGKRRRQVRAKVLVRTAIARR